MTKFYVLYEFSVLLPIDANDKDQARENAWSQVINESVYESEGWSERIITEEELMLMLPQVITTQAIDRFIQRYHRYDAKRHTAGAK